MVESYICLKKAIKTHIPIDFAFSIVWCHTVPMFSNHMLLCPIGFYFWNDFQIVGLISL